MASNILKKTSLWLCLILIVGGALRLVRLGQSPPSLNWDEVAIGYNAYSLLSTAKDEYGYKLPLHLRSFDDYKPALYSYLTIPAIALFGLNDWSPRVLSALLGTIIPILIYGIAKHLSKSNVIALIAAFLVAIEPWSVLFSRAAFETNLGLFLYLTSIYIFLTKKDNTKFRTLAIVILGISTYAYHAQKVLFIPTAFIFYFLGLKNRISRKELWGWVTIILVTLASQLYFSNGSGISRLSSTSILSIWTANPQVFPFIKQLVAHYMSYLSPANLFVRGSPEPTQRIPGFSAFYIFEFIFWLVGLAHIISERKKYALLIGLLLISPIPAAITWNWFYPARVLPLFALYSIVIAIGAHAIFVRFKKKTTKYVQWVLFSMAFIYINMNVFNFIMRLQFNFPYMERGAWQYGMKEIIVQTNDIREKYDHIVWETKTAQPHIFLLYYSRYDPLTYHSEIASLAQSKENRKSYDFGKYEFREVYWPGYDERASNTFFIGPPSSLPETTVKGNPRVDYFLVIKDAEGSVVAHAAGIR